MSLLTESRLPPCSVGVGDGNQCLGVAVLDPHVEWMRWCSICDSEQIFVAGWQCNSGLVGCCLGCGDERVEPFSRVNGKAA
jgi:hypothetical protein